MDVSARDLETPEGEVDFRKLFAEQDYSRDPNHPVLFGTYVDYRISCVTSSLTRC